MTRRHFLFVSDFDQTLSFNDSGVVMSEMLGIERFRERVRGMSQLNLVQSGAELAYLLLHDPDFRRVRQQDLIEVGRRIRLKKNIALLSHLLDRGIDGHRFDFYVVSAAPEDVVHAALAGLVPAERIIATRFTYREGTGEIESIVRVPAGYGKVMAVDELRDQLGVPAIARRTVMSDDALSVLIPVLEDILGYDRSQIRGLFERHGVMIQEWDRVRTDWLTIRDGDRALAPAGR